MRKAIHLNSTGSNCLHVRRDPMAVDLEIADRAPDELDRIAGLRVACALERPDNVFRREGRPVVPDDALAHIHPDLRLVVVPPPCGQKTGREGQVRLLPDRLIEDGAVDRLDRRIDRGGPDRRIERGKVDVEGDRELVGALRDRPSAEQKLRKNPVPPSASAWRRVHIEHSTLPVSKLTARPPTDVFTGSSSSRFAFARGGFGAITIPCKLIDSLSEWPPESSP